MALTFDVIIHGRVPSKKTLPVIAKEVQDNAVLAISITANYILHIVHYTNKIEHFSFISGCVMQVAKLLKEHWIVMLWQQLRLKTTLYHYKKLYC